MDRDRKVLGDERFDYVMEKVPQGLLLFQFMVWKKEEENNRRGKRVLFCSNKSTLKKNQNLSLSLSISLFLLSFLLVVFVSILFTHTPTY